MFGVTTSDDYQPVTWVGRHPVHVTTLLVAMHVFTAIVACFIVGAGILGHLAFDSALVLQRGEFWQLATYAFVHSPSALLWFAVEMYMLFIFGREVERFVGRRAFVVLYLSLLLAPAVLLLLAVLWVSIAVAFFFIRLRGIGPELVWWDNLKSRWQPKPKFHVVPRAAPRRVVEPENVHESIDPVLEKISRQGINSLTASERKALDRARARLLKKSK